MTACGPPEQAIDKFRHCYVRYEALLAQLHSEAESGPELAATDPQHATSSSSMALLQSLLGAASAAEVGLGEAPPASTAFERSFCHEVERLRQFVRSGLEQLWVALLDGCGQLRGLSEELLQAGAAAAGLCGPMGARLTCVRGSFDAVAQEVVLLELFVRQNASACARLAQTYDQQAVCQGEEVGADAVEDCYVRAAQAALLGGLRVDPLLVGLSDAYELCRLVESDAEALAGQHTQWVPPDKFERVTRKFWLRPSDVTRFKLEVIRHLPLLIFGDRHKLTEGSCSQVAFLRDQGEVTDSSAVTSVYYDNAQLSSYHDRLRKEDGASVVRVRWYGERSPSPDQRLFVERKVHREKHSGEASYKERAPLAQRHVADYSRGLGPPPSSDMGGGSGCSEAQVAFLAETQAFLTQRGQEPLLRTAYVRTAFQEASNNRVRISMDTQLCMVKEAGGPRPPGDWCRDMRAPLGATDAVHFPYAVVEVKLAGAEPPEWLEGLLQTGLLMPVPKFSKFLHGAALLFQPACHNVPYWFLPDEEDPQRMSPATWQEMADPADEYMQKGFLALFSREPEANKPRALVDSEEKAAPYRPSRLRFLQRNKTAPSGGTGDGCSTPNGSGSEPQISGSMWQDAAAAGGGGGGGSDRRHSTHPAQLSARHDGAASAGAGMLALATPTWPAYPNAIPLGGPPPLAAAADRHVARSSPADSKFDASRHSAEDLEAGLVGKPAEGSSSSSSSKRSKRSVRRALAAVQRKLSAGSGLPGAGGEHEQPSGRARALVRTRIEPKTFFANERTFLQWLQISVLIMITAVSLLGGSGAVSAVTGGGAAGGACDPSDKACFASKLSGAIIAPVALLFMGYALFMYKKRTYQILRRETVRYDDQWGPAVLVVILLAVFLLSYIITLVWMF